MNVIFKKAISIILSGAILLVSNPAYACSTDFSTNWAYCQTLPETIVSGPHMTIDSTAIMLVSSGGRHECETGAMNAYLKCLNEL